MRLAPVDGTHEGGGTQKPIFGPRGVLPGQAAERGDRVTTPVDVGTPPKILERLAAELPADALPDLVAVLEAGTARTSRAPKAEGHGGAPRRGRSGRR